MVAFMDMQELVELFEKYTLTEDNPLCLCNLMFQRIIQ